MGTVCRKRSSSRPLSKPPVVESVQKAKAWCSQDKTGEASCSQANITEQQNDSGDDTTTKESTPDISVHTETKELEVSTLNLEVKQMQVIGTVEPFELDSIA